MKVTGSYELPQAASKAAELGKFDAIICLGVLLKGETDHYDLIAHAVSQGLSAVGISSGVPVTFGVIATQELSQAEARAGGALDNKGAEAATAALEMVALYEEMGR